MQTIAGLSLIVAMTEPDRVIGRNGALPWRLPSDLRRFRDITTVEGIVVMGRITHESIIARIGAAGLPNRQHLILSRHTPTEADGFEWASSLEATCDAIIGHGGRACVIGGEQIFRLFLPLVQTAYVTKIHASIRGDTYFPEIPMEEWKCLRVSTTWKWHENDEYPTSFNIYERVKK